MRVTLFFTKGNSLQNWARMGILERETALYRRMIDQGVKVTFITYGNKQDTTFKGSLGGIEVLCNRWNLPPGNYPRLIPWLHGLRLANTSIMKTNQINGIDIAFRSAQLWHKPLIARGGYIYSEHISNASGPESRLARLAIQQEQKILPKAAQVVVTTEQIKDFYTSKYGIAPQRVSVIPNYVDTTVFLPAPFAARDPKKLCFAGRLEPQKNLAAVFEALKGLDVCLQVIGEGSLRQKLAQQAEDLGLNVNFLGVVPNDEIPTIMNQSQIYIQPSLYEGHPKTILEAMACGMAVIGANTPGTGNLIEHGKNGWLCDPTPEGIRKALVTLLADEPCRKKLGDQAARYINENFSLDRIVAQELSLYREVLE